MITSLRNELRPIRILIVSPNLQRAITFRVLGLIFIHFAPINTKWGVGSPIFPIPIFPISEKLCFRIGKIGKLGKHFISQSLGAGKGGKRPNPLD